MEFLWYSFVNGIYFIINMLISNCFWVLGIVAFVFLVFQEAKSIDEEYNEEERKLL